MTIPYLFDIVVYNFAAPLALYKVYKSKSYISNDLKPLVYLGIVGLAAYFGFSSVSPSSSLFYGTIASYLLYASIVILFTWLYNRKLPFLQSVVVGFLTAWLLTDLWEFPSHITRLLNGKLYAYWGNWFYAANSIYKVVVILPLLYFMLKPRVKYLPLIGLVWLFTMTVEPLHLWGASLWWQKEIMWMLCRIVGLFALIYIFVLRRNEE